MKILVFCPKSICSCAVEMFGILFCGFCYLAGTTKCKSMVWSIYYRNVRALSMRRIKFYFCELFQVKGMQVVGQTVLEQSVSILAFL